MLAIAKFLRSSAVWMRVGTNCFQPSFQTQASLLIISKMKTTKNVKDSVPTPAILLSDLVNTSHLLNSTQKTKPWQETRTVRVVAPKNCQSMVIDLSKPEKPKVRYKVTKKVSS